MTLKLRTMKPLTWEFSDRINYLDKMLTRPRFGYVEDGKVKLVQSDRNQNAATQKEIQQLASANPVVTREPSKDHKNSDIIIQKFGRREVLEARGGEYMTREEKILLSASEGGFSDRNVIIQSNGEMSLTSWPAGPVISIPRSFR